MVLAWVLVSQDVGLRLLVGLALINTYIDDVLRDIIRDFGSSQQTLCPQRFVAIGEHLGSTQTSPLVGANRLVDLLFVQRLAQRL